MTEYRVFSSSWCLLVYPTAAAAAAAEADHVREAPAAATAAGPLAAYWSKRLNCNVRCLEKNETFLTEKHNLIPSHIPADIISETGIIGFILPTSYSYLKEWI